MAKTTVGVFANYREAERAAQELMGHGYSKSDISVLANDEQVHDSQAIGEGSAAAVDAGAGAAIGGFAGLALGLVALAIPGIGPVVALGPIAAALTGAGIGAVAGGVIGAMTALGVPEEDAEHFATHVREGRAVLAVTGVEERADETAQFLRECGAVQVS